MMILLEGVLAPEDLALVRSTLAEISFVDGKATAGATARQVKANLQAPGTDERIRGLERFALDALMRHPTFDLAARPARFSRVLFSRYEPGMRYGAHTDDALMGRAGDQIRTDLAFTIFLAEPESYEGGALLVEGPAGQTRVKLPAGDAVLYPAGAIHEVETVGAGARLAAVGWVQSMIREPMRREILFDLSRGRAGASAEAVLLIDKAISNLLRLWAEP